MINKVIITHHSQSIQAARIPLLLLIQLILPQYQLSNTSRLRCLIFPRLPLNLLMHLFAQLILLSVGVGDLEDFFLGAGDF